MKKILLVMIAVVLLIGTLSFAALAADGPRAGYGPAGRPAAMDAFKSLNLTLEQRQKLLTIRYEFQKDTLETRYNLQTKQMELRKLWAAKTLDQEAIAQTTKEVTDLRIQLVTKTRAMFEQVKTVLTPEQQKKLEQMRSNFKHRAPAKRWESRRDGRGPQGEAFLVCPVR